MKCKQTADEMAVCRIDGSEGDHENGNGEQWAKITAPHYFWLFDCMYSLSLREPESKNTLLVPGIGSI